jgi:hypothetical protein
MSVKQVTINGNRYHIGRLEHTLALETFVLVMRNLGPGIGEALKDALKGGKGLKDLDLSPDAIGRAVQDVCLRLSAADAIAVGQAFGTVCTVIPAGPKPAKLDLSNVKVYERHFAGRLGEWFQWVGVCMQHNYADFLELLTSAKGSADVASEPPTGSDEKDPE